MDLTSLSITPELLRLITEIDEFKGSWRVQVLGVSRHYDKDTRHRGEYKKHVNSVEAFGPDGESLGVVFQTTTPFNTPKQMRDLLIWTREAMADNSYPPLIVTSIFNVVFLAIHPFQDGNSRLSRVLVNLLLLKTGYSYIPYASLESIVEKNKEAYYPALQRTQKTLHQPEIDWLPWLNFFLNSFKRQKDHLAEKTEALGQYSALPHESMHMSDEMGISLYQRFTEKEAAQFLGVSPESLSLIRGQRKIAYLASGREHHRILWLTAS